MKIVVVDYGMGNLKSVLSVFDYLGYDNVVISNNPNILKKADKLILPGVGSFAMAMSSLIEFKLVDLIRDLAALYKVPLLGICLGMQLMGKSSTEGGFTKGLGLVDGVVENFTRGYEKIPHVGYNQVKINKNSRLFKGISQDSDYYFTHSYRMKSEKDIGQSACNYIDEFVCAFELDNTAGVQFHPELSQANGIKLLRNFLELF